MMGKCEECKHLNKELAFCRACGAKWLNDKDGENSKYFEQKQPQSIFDRITASPEALAPKLVYSVIAEDICLGAKTRYYYSTITGQRYDEETKAIEATLAELKKKV